MREILFRGQRCDNGEWVYGNLITDGEDVFVLVKEDLLKGLDVGGWIDGVQTYEAVPETVGQYTGMTDKNGKKVFEGDIVKGKSEYFGNGSLNQKAVVLYDRGQFLLSFGETLEECKQLNDFEVVGVWSGDVEVIGNIHDNSELLTE